MSDTRRYPHPRNGTWQLNVNGPQSEREGKGTLLDKEEPYSTCQTRLTHCGLNIHHRSWAKTPEEDTIMYKETRFIAEKYMIQISCNSISVYPTGSKSAFFG